MQISVPIVGCASSALGSRGLAGKERNWGFEVMKAALEKVAGLQP